MATTIYRDATNKGPIQLIGGFNGARRTARQVRATWTPVKFSIDRKKSIRLHALKRTLIDLPPGRHQFVVSGRGFLGSKIVVHIADDREHVFSVHPNFEVGVSATTPLGQLAIREVEDLSSLEPNLSYRNMVTSPASGSMVHTVIISMLVGLCIFCLGLAALATVVFEALAGDIFRAVFIGILSLVIIPPCVIIGLSTLVSGLRFLALPPIWRK